MLVLGVCGGCSASREKLSARMRAQWQDPEYRARALKHLNESRAMQNEETRRKISERMKVIWEQQRFPRNRTISDETRKKISDKLKVGRPRHAGLLAWSCCHGGGGGRQGGRLRAGVVVL